MTENESTKEKSLPYVKNIESFFSFLNHCSIIHEVAEYVNCEEHDVKSC